MFVKFKVLLLICLTLMLLSGCASNLTIDASVPKPLVEKLPLTAQVNYSEAFKNYLFAETDKRRSLETVKFGQAQYSVFQQVFSSVLTVKPVGEASQLLIEPEMLEFQYAVPAETKLSIYEVWLKYRIKISDNDGNIVADWLVKGYGKTPARTLVSPAIMFDEVCNIALRDVGAQLALGFGNQASIVEFAKKSKTVNRNQLKATEVQ